MDVFQMLKEEFVLPEAFQDWSSYRRTVTELIAEAPGRSILILGAGRCNDIDLRKLRELGAELTLLDVDGAAMEQGLLQYGLSPKDGGIHLRRESLTGITEEDVARFFNTMYLYVLQQGKALKGEAFLRTSLGELSGIQRKLGESEWLQGRVKEKWDTVICLGVHSQLFTLLSYVWQVLAENVVRELPKETIPLDLFLDELKKVSGETIPRLNAAILQAAEKRVLAGCEYSKTAPVEGAAQAILDFHSRTGTDDCVQKGEAPEFTLREKLLHWPFHPAQQKSYELLLMDIGLRPVSAGR